MDARVGLTEKRQLPPTPPNLSVPEHLALPKAGPVRRLPVGAEPQPGGGVHFRVWAPACREVLGRDRRPRPAALQAEPDGYFSLLASQARPGMRYRFRLDRER